MRFQALTVMAVLMAAGCDPGTGPSGSQASAPRASSAPAVGHASCQEPAPSYGLILSGGRLQLVGATGCLGPIAQVAPPSAHRCADGLPAVLAPPISASNNRVYFRDGDTKISFLTPGGQTGDSTTVPGGPSTVSFFSVSPDDQRIAVLVEDLAPSSAINLRLYVEDLNNHGHHADIYTTTIPKGQSGMTLWPVGWHEGRLVLAVVLACSAAPVYHPAEWHVVDAVTADRLVNIDVRACGSSLIPSPAGIACASLTGAAPLRIYDWKGKVQYDSGAYALNQNLPVGVSPSGQSLFYNGGTACPDGRTMCPRVWANTLDGGGQMAIVEMHQGCLWINDSAILAPDAVIAYPSGAVMALPGSGDCVGRFPGGL